MAKESYSPHGDQEEKEKGKGAGIAISPSRTCPPGDLTSSHQTPPLKGISTSQLCHLLGTKTSTHEPLWDILAPNITLTNPHSHLGPEMDPGISISSKHGIVHFIRPRMEACTLGYMLGPLTTKYLRETFSPKTETL
jgi:hypothetical protein